MKKILLITVSFLLNVSLLFSSELYLSYLDNDIIGIEYKTDGQFFMGENLDAKVYAFSNDSAFPRAYEFQLNFDGSSSYNANFTLPEDKIYFMISVTNGEITDDNRGDFWSGFNNNKIVENSNLFAGLSYLGNLPDNINRNVDFKTALKFFKEEVDKFPKNVQANIAYLSLQLDLQKISYPDFEKSLKKNLDLKMNLSNESQLKAVARALRILNQEDKAEKLERDFINNYPKSNIAEENEVSKLATADNLEEFSNSVLKYLNSFPVSMNRERIFSALASGYLQTGDYKKIIEILKSIEDVPGTVYAQIAFSILNDELYEEIDLNKRIQTIVKLMNKAINQLKSNNIKYKPEYITEKEWNRRNIVRLAALYEQYGQILMSVEELNEALNMFEESLDLYESNTPINLYENIIEACNALDLKEKAYKTCITSLNHYHPTEYIIKMTRKLHKELVKMESVEVLIAKLTNSSKIDRLKKLSYLSLNKEIDNVKFKTQSNKQVNLDDYKGKILVLSFWSTWCDPCDEALLGLDSLAKLYSENKAVKCASVNLWESKEDASKLVKEYFSEFEPKFEILIDENLSSPFEFGITGLPYICFISKDGKMQFINRGYTSKDEFVNASKDKIDYLLR